VIDVNILALMQLLAFLLVTGYALYLFGHVVYSRYMFIRLGKKANLRKDLQARVNQLVVNMFGHKTLLKDRKSGIMHFVMFYGFIILQFGAIDLIGKGLSHGWHLPLGAAYPYFIWFQEITVLLVLLAAGYAGYRRYIEKLERLKRGWRAGIVIMFIFGLMLSVLLSQGMEMIWRGYEPTPLQPVGSLIAIVFGGIGAAAAGVLFYVFWWLHLLILLSFLLYVPQSKHAHILFAPVNIFLRKMGAPGKLAAIDFEDETAEHYGAGQIEHFTQKQLIDLYACVECGRCTNVCPASGTGKMLSPMHLIVKMRDHLTEKGAAVTSRTPWMPAYLFAGTKANQLALAAAANGGGLSPDSPPPAAKSAAEGTGIGANLLDDVITEQELWACTTCRNCEDACPVANEHVDKIVDMRRYLVMTEGRIPAEAGRTLNNIERQGNPWGLNRNDRDKWKEGLEQGLTAPSVKEGQPFDYLFYVGSMGSYDSRSMKITHAFIKLMNHAQVRFAVLGSEEKNSGDTARRLGNEYLYQQLAMENVETFVKYKAKKIVTIDPHAYNTFKNEYVDFGLPADVEVYHHTQLIAEWLREGRLQPSKTLKERIAYHDPCYLGRHNQVYDSPRAILAAIPGVELAEMARSRSDSMCCGAGGGLMWLEENEGKRVNVQRTEQALEVKPTMIGTACPYCLTMITDGTKAKEADDRVRALDVAEILARAL
jgi:Fe-S oxidoreductase